MIPANVVTAPTKAKGNVLKERTLAAAASSDHCIKFRTEREARLLKDRRPFNLDAGDNKRGKLRLLDADSGAMPEERLSDEIDEASHDLPPSNVGVRPDLYVSPSRSIGSILGQANRLRSG